LPYQTGKVGRYFTEGIRNLTMVFNGIQESQRDYILSVSGKPKSISVSAPWKSGKEETH